MGVGGLQQKKNGPGAQRAQTYARSCHVYATHFPPQHSRESNGPCDRKQESPTFATQTGSGVQWPRDQPVAWDSVSAVSAEVRVSCTICRMQSLTTCSNVTGSMSCNSQKEHRRRHRHRAGLTGRKKRVRNANRNKPSQGPSLLHGQDMGKTQDHRTIIQQWLAVGGGWWLVAVGDWWQLAVGGWCRLAVGAWQLVASGAGRGLAMDSWRLVVSGGCS